MGDDQIYGNVIGCSGNDLPKTPRLVGDPPVRDCERTDNIRELGTWKNEVVVTVLDEPKILSEDTFNVSASFGDISSYPPCKHQVRVRVLAMTLCWSG